MSALVYFAAAHLGLLLATINKSASPVWPATGIAFALLLRFGNSAWVSIALGAFAANLFTNESLLSTFVISIGNTLEALVGVWIFQKLLSYKNSFTYQSETVAITAASMIASTVSASIGVASLAIAHIIPIESLPQVWITWWVGDALGGLVVTPLLMMAPKPNLSLNTLFHFIAALCLSMLSIYFVFIPPAGSAFVFLLFPPVLYAARFLKNRLVFFISLFICASSIWLTTQGHGPFAYGNLKERLIHHQFFLIAMAITSLVLHGFINARLSNLPTAVLLICWIISGTLFYSFEKHEKERDQIRFHALVSDAHTGTLGRMRAYEEVLRGGLGLYAASKSVELSEWQAYYQTLTIAEVHPGINGLGVIWSVPPSQRQKFEKELIQQGLKQFKIKAIPGYSFHKNQNHYAIKFIEPLDTNSIASGIDISTEPNRKAAADLSRDTGQGAVTSKVKLVQDQKERPGFLFLLPIYRKQAPLSTVAERRKAHLGWVYGPFIYENFFNSILKDIANEVELDVFENEIENKELIFSSHSDKNKSSTYDQVTHIQFGQHKFTLAWRRAPTFLGSHNTTIAWVGLCGALFSLLLTNLMVNLQTINQRSHELANELTAELRIAQKQSEEDQKFLFKISDLAPNNLYIIDFQTRTLIYSNSNVYKTLGYSLEDVKAKGFAFTKDVTHPDDLASTNQRFLDLEKSNDGEIIETIKRIRDVFGKWHWLLIRESVFTRDEQGKPKQIIGVSQDITEIKNSEQEIKFSQEKLKESERRLVYALEGSSDGIWDWDLAKNEIYVSEKLASLFGGPQLMKLSSPQDMRHIIHPDDFQKTESSILRHLAGTTPVHEVEARLKMKNGEWKWVLTRGKISERAADGSPLRITGIHIDIDRLKRVEEELEFSRHELELSNQRIEKEKRVAIEATQVKSQFLANMSHEIRTPINGIIGMTDLLMNTALSKQQKEYTQTVSQSAEDLLAIINDILDFSKVEAGKLDLEIIAFNINDILDGTIKSLAFLAKQKNIILNLDIHVEEHSFFKGDPVRLRQVLVNLIGNAIKFTPNGHVQVKVTSIETDTDSSLLKFEVTDTGIGIPKKTLGRLFQAFSQADGTTHRRFGGTGLGLSISKKLVELMGGEIGVHSQVGTGSTFWFNIRLEHSQAKQLLTVDLASESTQPSFNARILVAEDNSINQKVILAILKKLGYTPHVVANGKEVLETLREIPFDLILMDCQMPEMDGYETTREIRSNKILKRQNMPIIAMTASAMSGDREKCLGVGMDDYITKPMKEQDLFNVIEKWIYKERDSISSQSEAFYPPSLLSAPPEKTYKGHILVVEDNLVNQSVICANLQNFSFSFDVAMNGIEALTLMKTKKYDVIFMDCNMPEMDGYETTRKIRLISDENIANTPIVALTANAMSSDREKCLSAGMDDYLTKPIKSKVLADTIAKWMKVDSVLPSKKPGENQKQPAGAIDLAIIQELRNLQKLGKPNLLENLIRLYFESAEKDMVNIRDAIVQKNAIRLAQVAHSLKSSSANVGAHKMAHICFLLEKIGRSNELPLEVLKLLENLEDEFVQAKQDLLKIQTAA